MPHLCLIVVHRSISITDSGDSLLTFFAEAVPYNDVLVQKVWKAATLQKRLRLTDNIINRSGMTLTFVNSSFQTSFFLCHYLVPKFKHCVAKDDEVRFILLTVTVCVPSRTRSTLCISNVFLFIQSTACL